MSFDIFINFNGMCEEAVKFYSDIFKLDIPKMMKYSDAPPSPDFPLPGEENFIMYTS